MRLMRGYNYSGWEDTTTINERAVEKITQQQYRINNDSKERTKRRYEEAMASITQRRSQSSRGGDAAKEMTMQEEDAVKERIKLSSRRHIVGEDEVEELTTECTRWCNQVEDEAEKTTTQQRDQCSQGEDEAMEKTKTEETTTQQRQIWSNEGENRMDAAE